MRVLIAGSSGLIGMALKADLEKKGDEVFILVREKELEGPHEIFWDPYSNAFDPKKFEGFDIAVNLCGENVAGGRWSDKKKNKILASRVKTTETLAQIFSGLQSPPKVWINASAVGYYGNRGDDEVNENSSPGEGFLSNVCTDWERATEGVDVHGVRVVNLRMGVVLSTKGGALEKMLLPFKFGLGGVVGSGKQYISWVAIDDVVGIVNYIIENQGIKGAVNAVSPNPVTNYELTKALGKVLGRPTIFPLPALFVRLIMGEMGEELMLGGAKVMPSVLEKSGYDFLYPTVESALYHVINSEE